MKVNKHFFDSQMNLQLKCFFTLLAASLVITFAELSGLPSFCSCDCYPVSWEGFYINGQLGMGEDRGHAKFTNANFFNTLGPTLLGAHFNHNTQGVVGGGALGYHYQSDYFVAGIEGGAISTNCKKSYRSPFFPATDVYTSHLQYIANAKIRIGYACESLLTFITGGWAGGNTILNLNDTSSSAKAKLTQWTNGWTVGIGFDCKFAERLSMGLAYDYTYLKYNNKKASCPNCGIGVGLGSPQIDNNFDVQTLTLRLNYFFCL